MWSDHANEISVAYSGTGALKTDFTRTGKRTKVGALEDGYKSIMRYIKNNYFDGARQVRFFWVAGSASRCQAYVLMGLAQDAFDLMTGTWSPRRGWSPASLVSDRRPLVTRAVSMQRDAGPVQHSPFISPI